ncbi:MAG: hydrogenase maturation protease, partial [Candidatus Omnitrophica bacterium]|nr:hydrogenase maturation protease [Candidatus Omnitrophota bacterium]
RADGKPGDIYKFGPGDFECDRRFATSLHDITLQEVLALAKKLAPLPPIAIFGVQPKVIDWGMELTEELRRALPRLSELVLEEIRHA